MNAIQNRVLTGTALACLAASAWAQDEAANQEQKQPGEVVTVFEERSVLGDRGQFTIEPSLTYSHNSSTLVAVEGFTIIPALVVGLINVSQAQRDTFVAALSFRYALNNQLQFNIKVPFVRTEENIRERQAFDDSPVDIINNSSGEGLGDVEAGIQYQFNTQSAPYFTGSLRVKSRTGKDPFEIERRPLRDKDGRELGFVFAEQPTGSGFWSVQGGLSLVFPTDPAVVYGGISYLWNKKRDVGDANGGVIDPGDAVGFSFGIGFAVNERTSFSLGYDHSTINRTKQENDTSKIDSQFERYQVGSFLLGVNQAVGARSNLNLSLAIGVTEQAPDLQLTLRMPFTF